MQIAHGLMLTTQLTKIRPQMCQIAILKGIIQIARRLQTNHLKNRRPGSLMRPMEAIWFQIPSSPMLDLRLIREIIR